MTKTFKYIKSVIITWLYFIPYLLFTIIGFDNLIYKSWNNVMDEVWKEEILEENKNLTGV